MTDSEVAAYMLDNFSGTWLYQDVIVQKIKEECGEDFVYTNANYNLAISKNVLKEFRKKTEGLVVWERSDKSWRKLTESEKGKYTGRQDD
jgi:hypothetical protein